MDWDQLADHNIGLITSEGCTLLSRADPSFAAHMLSQCSTTERAQGSRVLFWLSTLVLNNSGNGMAIVALCLESLVARFSAGGYRKMKSMVYFKMRIK